MATLIKATGKTELVSPQNGKAFGLPELQAFVGGYIEALRLWDGRIMWINEDGKRKQLPMNLVASEIAWKCTGIAPDDCIVGNVLIASKQESGEE